MTMFRNDSLSERELKFMKDGVYTASVRIENFTRALNFESNEIATRMQLPKKEVVRLALTEFVERHKSEVK